MEQYRQIVVQTYGETGSPVGSSGVASEPGVERPVRLLGAPVKLSRTPADAARGPGPALGEHTDAVLGEAGYTAEDIAALRSAGEVA